MPVTDPVTGEPVFSDDEIDAQLALVESKLAGRRLDLYKPHPKQELFHRLGGDIAITDRALIAGNQCVPLFTPLDLPRGRERQFGEMLGEQDFDVQSWDGVSRSIAQASRVFLRGIEPTFRLALGNGQSLYCSGRHQVLTSAGWLSLDQLVRLSSGWRCQQTAQYSQDSYVADDHLCDARLPSDQGIGRVALPSGDDVHTRTPLSWHTDGAGSTLRCTRVYPLSVLLPTSVDDPSQLAALCGQFPDPTLRLDAQWPITKIRDVRQQLLACGLPEERQSSACRSVALDAGREGDRESSDVEETLARNSYLSRALGQSVSWCDLGSIDLESLGDDPRTVIVLASSPPLVGGVEIIGIQPIGIYPIFDTTVKKTHNYLTAGVISHNCGKTLAAAAETAFHLVGRYPSWWAGKRFPSATRGWVGCTTNQAVRDAAQFLLMGAPGEMGTGMIPARYIKDYQKSSHGVPNSLESVQVKHVSGKISHLQFKSYDQGRLRWQGATLDFVWFDEEPPMDIFVEGRTRTNVPGNFVYMTFTPLLGMSEVMIRFLKEKPRGSIVIPMSIEDALHYSPEQRASVIAGYPEHERKARAYGIPQLGSGAVFPIEEEQIITDSFPIPPHWPRICGMDIGWEHPTACAWIAWDRDTDTLYVYDTHRVKEQTPIFHSATIKAKGVWIPVAWPHDGLQHDKGSGVTIANQYRALGVNMLKEKATHPPERGKKEGSGGYGVEAGVYEILHRMQTGRFKVFNTCHAWFEEYRMYYRDEGGLIVKKHDDLMSATRIGVMMLRFAKVRRPDPVIAPKIEPYQPSYSSTGVLG